MNREEYSDYIEKKYGHLLIQNIYSGEISGKKSKIALCKCDCGNEIEVLESDLFTGKVICCEDCQMINEGRKKEISPKKVIYSDSHGINTMDIEISKDLNLIKKE